MQPKPPVLHGRRAGYPSGRSETKNADEGLLYWIESRFVFVLRKNASSAVESLPKTRSNARTPSDSGTAGASGTSGLPRRSLQRKPYGRLNAGGCHGTRGRAAAVFAQDGEVRLACGEALVDQSGFAAHGEGIHLGAIRLAFGQL